jgi:hypothetical protein
MYQQEAPFTDEEIAKKVDERIASRFGLILSLTFLATSPSVKDFLLITFIKSLPLFVN